MIWMNRRDLLKVSVKAGRIGQVCQQKHVGLVQNRKGGGGGRINQKSAGWSEGVYEGAK